MSQKSLFDPAGFGLDEDDLIRESIAISVIKAAGGAITGRIRFQKLVFLLDKLGLESGFDYTYHHYGPYSSDLASALDFAKAFGLVSENVKHRSSDGARYSVFSVETGLKSNLRSDFLNGPKIKSAIGSMNEATATVLELAATAYWLKHDEKLDDWKSEITRRKGQKTAQGRLQAALELLSGIGLDLEPSSNF